jgi:hypothetical protein
MRCKKLPIVKISGCLRELSMAFRCGWENAAAGLPWQPLPGPPSMYRCPNSQHAALPWGFRERLVYVRWGHARRVVPFCAMCNAPRQPLLARYSPPSASWSPVPRILARPWGCPTSLPVGDRHIHLYSGLLLHDMGPALDNKVVQGRQADAIGGRCCCGGLVCAHSSACCLWSPSSH